MRVPIRTICPKACPVIQQAYNSQPTLSFTLLEFSTETLRKIIDFIRVVRGQMLADIRDLGKNRRATYIISRPQHSKSGYLDADN